MIDTAQNIAELKNNNRYRILDCLRSAPLSRAELSRQTGLAKSSVTTITNRMIDEGLLCEAGLARKSNKAGRTRVLLDLCGDFGFAVGIHLHRKRITVAAVDLRSRILFEFGEKTAAFDSSEAAFSYINDTLRQRLSEAGLDLSRLVGIGVSSPGPLNFESGMILEPTNFPLFNHFCIVDRLRELYGCPVFLENNAVTLARFEHYHVCRQTGSSLFVTVSDGIGAALLQNGEVYRGSHGIAGEIGHVSVDPFGEVCPCGSRGCLEHYATLSALQRRFGFDSYEQVVDGAQAGDPVCSGVMEFLIATLGAALVGAVNLFDLDKIVLYGEYSYQAAWLTEALERFIASHAAICKAHPVSVVPSGQRGADAVVGAAIPALDNFFKQNTVR